MKILLLGWAQFARAWEMELVARLRARGWDIISGAAAGAPPRHPLDEILALESRRFGSTAASVMPPRHADRSESVDLVIDLTGQGGSFAAPMLTLRWSGATDFATGLAHNLVRGELPTLLALLDGTPVASARPMISDRVWLSKAAEEQLAGAIGLVEHCVARFVLGQLGAGDVPEPEIHPDPARYEIWSTYLRRLVPGLAGRAIGRLKKRAFDWQVGLRRMPLGTVAAPGRLDGPGFSVLADDGERFYADPFLFGDARGAWLFVEEYPFAGGKGVLSVAALDESGQVGTPRKIIEEPYHLSYPQVFAVAGEIFVLPEAGAGRELVLYRAVAFPDEWVRDTVLLRDVELGDMTLLVRDGRFWLFGTQRSSGFGSISDTMVVFMADDLRGPYRPHPLNPILIDRAAARPGGAFFEQEGRTFLPVQDGTHSYGGGLGLAELLELDEGHVRFAAPVPIAGSALGTPIHTLNGAGGYEVVDWFVPTPRRSGRA